MAPRGLTQNVNVQARSSGYSPFVQAGPDRQPSRCGVPNLDANSILSDWAKCMGLPTTPLPPAFSVSPEFSETNSSGYTRSNNVGYWPRGTDQTSCGILLSSPKTPNCISTVFTALLTMHLPAGVTVGRVTVSPPSLPQFGDKSVLYEAQVPFSDNGEQLTFYRV